MLIFVPMNLYTTVDTPSQLPRFTHADKLLMLGSCFATEMGERLRAGKFGCHVNPYGVLYNPLSIATALREIRQGKLYQVGDLFEYRECWHSPMHHSDFSFPSPGQTLQAINAGLQAARTLLPALSGVLLTFGSSYVYEEKEHGRIVGNCHKLPERCFTRRRLSVGEIVEAYASLFSEWLPENPSLKFLFTVSPIRHLRDGLHANQLSKSTLLLAVDELCRLFPDNAFYFPAYELLMDELRDYRFYADDLVHPSSVAVSLVWERFCEACLTSDARGVMHECEEIHKALSHKPFRPDSDAYKRFLGQIVLKIEQLTAKFPYLDFENERELCRILLNK